MDKQRTLKSADQVIDKILSGETSQAEFDLISERIMSHKAINHPEHDLELLRSLVAFAVSNRGAQATKSH